MSSVISKSAGSFTANESYQTIFHGVPTLPILRNHQTHRLAWRPHLVNTEAKQTQYLSCLFANTTSHLSECKSVFSFSEVSSNEPCIRDLGVCQLLSCVSQLTDSILFGAQITPRHKPDEFVQARDLFLPFAMCRPDRYGASFDDNAVALANCCPWW